MHYILQTLNVKLHYSLSFKTFQSCFTLHTKYVIQNIKLLMSYVAIRCNNTYFIEYEFFWYFS